MDKEFDQEEYNKMYDMVCAKTWDLYYKYEHCFTSNQAKGDVFDYLDHDEAGLGVGLLCYILIKNDIAVSQEDYDFIKDLRGNLADDDDKDGYFDFKLTDLKVLRE
ncbi:hypothetical protein PVA45_06080 [Entomospira entomophila]|uniref:Uncharacterized protein n=1 Tax=Entomospira entomophila TaxID=2719988 RepID=A0A968G9L4_9SPIO|nr:hypothetical protein [Entomospira entomophilus]NIZ41067.1 hypothetical protein [Entomospira entomophilus]WDI35276.1 hypothetical protein PVA45_06080 [Entomospira entomophilus]